MNIAIIGAGYVGLVTGVSLANLGHKVICIDSDHSKVSRIEKGISPIFEPGIEEGLKKVIGMGLFRASTLLEEAVLESDITIIAVGTPTVNNKINLSQVRKASAQVGKVLAKLKKYHIVAVKSTVLPGVTEEIIKPILEKYSKKKTGELGFVMNPEFLREGSALDDALHPDRIIIGQFDEKSGREFAKIYAKVSTPIIFTNLATAELTKYAANALFATLISYSNEVARIAESIDKVDAQDVWRGVHLDKRLSPFSEGTRIKPGILSYILSGCGFGGSCFPKDIKALLGFAQKKGIQAQLIKSVIDINSTQPYQVLLLLKKALGKNLKDKKIAVLGLTFKPNTDDIRESPAFPIIEELIAGGAKVYGHDPMAYKKILPPQLATIAISLVDTVEEAIKNAHAVIVITAWKEYAKLTPRIFKKHMSQPVVIDARRIYDKYSFLHAGIIYKGIGL